MKSKKVFLTTSCMFFICLSVCGLIITPALAADKTVCASGCDQTIIQAGIDDAFDDDPSGGTVTVTDSGPYNEVITMKDGVHLVSATGQTPTITCSTAWENAVIFSGSITCNLRGFEIINPLAGAGIFLNGSGAGITATIENCHVHDSNFGAGIRLNGVVSPTIIGCNINSNYTTGIATSGVHSDLLESDSSIIIKGNNTITNNGFASGSKYPGIYLKGSGGDNIQVTIGGSGAGDGNIISNNSKSGIRLEDIDKVSIDNNTINDNKLAGILLIDVGSATGGDAIMQNNTISSNTKAGINIGGASYVTIGGNNDIYSNYAGVAFNMGDVKERPGAASFQPVTITGNDINNNTKAGIAVIDHIDETTGTITIDDNEIHQNSQAGIAIFNACKAVITDNNIYTHGGAAGIFTGDWSDKYPKSGSGFDRTNGPAHLTIKRNKVYGNRAGMRLDHASGTISNNLVFGNSRAGIRFSGNNVSPYAPFSASWGITEIMNNTVDDNGSYVAQFSEDRGGGIVYDDINVTTDPITGLSRNFFDRPVGATQNAITIKNNIVANNMKAGIKFCADNSSDNRSYNLFYGNVVGTCDTEGAVDCGRMCRSKTLGKCYAPDVNCCDQDTWVNSGAPFPGAWATGEICGEDPLFNDPYPADPADYTLQGGSPAIGTGSDSNDMGAYGGADPILW